ncbi:hypothetical protein SAMN05421734_101231 [Pelagirhabdus alkalitolerans]|uniref:Uncharacterized protein n=1 Tax=Pelagirhabdus alkalitolerans TaxID=1612202 RepID=A0A1G6GL18_9BACI|nr:hypothetical protein [Pelagirhabdus alkalitolerans]SDB82609.1 hypothetical protein SAMN05421734_101231 [Pelagirhabdus alkalitolerans]
MKNVQVFVKDENEAEDLKTKLAKYNTEDIRVEKLVDDDLIDFVVPFVPSGTAGVDNAFTGTGTSHAVAFTELSEEEKKAARDKDTILAFKVAEKDLKEVVAEIQEAGGYLDRNFFDS